MADDPHPNETLSQELQRLVGQAAPGAPLSLNVLLAGTGGRGLFLVVMLLCLPFITPIPLPGVSTVLGLVIGVLAVRLALGLPPRLPKSLGERSLEGGFTQKVLSASVKILRVIEKLARPRRSTWLAWPAVRFVNAALVALMAFLLMLPFPPFPPFTNSLPAYSILLLAASMMEEDGVLIWAGYLVSAGTIAYLLVILSALEAAFLRLFHSLFAVLLG
ncbi:MAG: exopolysaccharide biosynthesis protein [Verrucomicrobia bacterium]|nr:exopolysaccharide biosynthesis protein [Verrucomicrobiota bacterium]